MPTNRPETMMMMSESTPLKYTSLITRRKRLKLVPEEASTSHRKRAMVPARQTPSITLWPRRPSGRRISSTRASRQSHVLRVRRRGVVERHRPVGLAVHELLNVRQLALADLVGRAFADDHAVGDEVEIVHELQRFDHVMRHDDGSRSEGVVQRADEAGDHGERDGIQSGEGLV